MYASIHPPPFQDDARCNIVHLEKCRSPTISKWHTDRGTNKISTKLVIVPNNRNSENEILSHVFLYHTQNMRHGPKSSVSLKRIVIHGGNIKQKNIYRPHFFPPVNYALPQTQSRQYFIHLFLHIIKTRAHHPLPAPPRKSWFLNDIPTGGLRTRAYTTEMNWRLPLALPHKDV